MNLVDTDYLGIVTNGKVTIHSNAIDEINIATEGLTVNGVKSLGKKLNWDHNLLAFSIGTTTRTLERYSADKKRLGAKVSENALEIARISSQGTAYFGDVKRWNEWLNTPNTQFGNQEPKSVIHTIRGRELIKRVLLGLEYGFTA
ncbi:type II toxin-antitoxin system Xre/ParS family antitoxin [Pseudoalteromonas tunicata]|uniref:Antitoxin Xre/MbcA/ParS-like toxin-binding domain-containing protein n=1 Tax=Pseudoalteromonas tunicata D2 TaxID=87626 RepID=A4C9W5_9GAMM|nr:antitoxin Xre/MbcA/ParS toxin-binding domain-containing protein [Pseudoalteromonas tunicata]ATC94720.1 hypothetical protein PTUN_a2202 [Pseudoalteromonas tunicata]AXT30430.1 DUF2384 domain-containing protein [Pseudoalteromonas tunicata]EAR28173.1 hypothetical protein PTD2_20197 [Pseudoalteromonas tunicata D2]